MQIEICIGRDYVYVSREQAEALQKAKLIDTRCRKCSNDFDPTFHPDSTVTSMEVIRVFLKDLKNV